MSTLLTHRSGVLGSTVRAALGTIFRVGYNEPVRTGSWSVGTGEYYSNTTGSSIQVTFTGTSFGIYATVDKHHGVMRVVIDGVNYAFDQYSDVRAEHVLAWTSPPLANTAHSVQLQWNGTRNAASTGTTITFGGVSVTSTAGDPYPGDGPTGVVLLDESFADTYPSLSSSNNGVHPWLRMEPGDPVQSITDGFYRINASGGFIRQFSNFRFSGPGKATLISTRARVNSLDSTTTDINGTFPGMKLGWKSAYAPGNAYSLDDWRSVDASQDPGSFIFVHGLGTNGRVELARNKAGPIPAGQDGYESPFFNFNRGYTLGTWVEHAIYFKHNSGTNWTVQYYDNATGTGTPYFNQTVSHPTLPVQPGFLWLRTDFCRGEYDWLKIEDVT